LRAAYVFILVSWTGVDVADSPRRDFRKNTKAGSDLGARYRRVSLGRAWSSQQMEGTAMLKDAMPLEGLVAIMALILLLGLIRLG
jgi:hypothetical protein